MAGEARAVAEVFVDIPADPVDRPFDYLIPDEWVGEVRVGSRVLVPFGNRKLIGYVTGIKDTSSFSRLKPVLEVLDLEPPLTPELVKLGLYMAEECLCRTITALQALVPAVLKGTYEKTVRLAPDADASPASLAELTAEPLFAVLREKGEITREEAIRLPGITPSLLRHLAEAGKIILEERVGDRVTRRNMTWVWPARPDKLKAELEEIPARAAKQRDILRFFLEQPGEIPLPELLAKVKTVRSTVERLVEKGLLRWEEREVERDPFAGRRFERTSPLPLTEEQRQAWEAIVEPMRRHTYHPVLLHGVTGSGKTEVYLQAIEETLRLGREAIVLVPEISLTPQMVARFKGRFGEQVAVLHSGLSNGERYDEWRKIRSGRVKVAIGARSAVFAPFTDLGLIIIDEEHESSYKQEEHPKYHAREIARWRAREHGAVLVLGSATPALETMVSAQIGEMEVVRLNRRVGGRPFPTVEVVDMREELRAGNRSMFSRTLRDELVSCVERGEQAILFLNRRGFSTFILCRDCGEALMCPHCDISLTFHQTNRTVRCHYCGYAERLPDACPHCGSKQIRHFGTGTQKVEEELVRRFPGLRVIRMDVDTTSRKGAHERLLTAFAERKADVLLGTQMIAKGLDFPAVTLVGVIAADTMLNLPDYRAAERTFQLLTQVSGRAGRHERPGKVVIQTYAPEHYSIDLAARHQVDPFYLQEWQVRKQHRYPPFCGLFSILISHPDRMGLMRAGREIVLFLERHLPPRCELLGPTPAPIPRLKDRFRLQILLKYPPEADCADLLKPLLRQVESLSSDKELNISIDRDVQI
jgi:primosomal protein N' (replication factor Y)